MILGDAKVEYPEYDQMDIEKLKEIKQNLEQQIEVKDDSKNE